MEVGLCIPWWAESAGSGNTGWMLSTCPLSVWRPLVTDLWLRASGGKGTVGVRDATGHPSCRGNLKHMSLQELWGHFFICRSFSSFAFFSRLRRRQQWYNKTISQYLILFYIHAQFMVVHWLQLYFIGILLLIIYFSIPYLSSHRLTPQGDSCSLLPK